MMIQEVVIFTFFPLFKAYLLLDDIGSNEVCVFCIHSWSEILPGCKDNE